jgi:Spy/CpxP family protein refolding chaperone
MSKKKWLTAVAVLTLGASLALAAPNEGWGKHGGRHGEWSAEFAQKLNLTEAQKTQLRDLNKSFRQDNAAFLQSFHQTMEDYHAAMKSGDTAKANSLKPSVDSQKAQMKQLRDAQDQKISAILTPDQRAQWQQLKAERAARRQSRENKQ